MYQSTNAARYGWLRNYYIHLYDSGEVISGWELRSARSCEHLQPLKSQPPGKPQRIFKLTLASLTVETSFNDHVLRAFRWFPGTSAICESSSCRAESCLGPFRFRHCTRSRRSIATPSINLPATRSPHGKSGRIQRESSVSSMFAFRGIASLSELMDEIRSW